MKDLVPDHIIKQAYDDQKELVAQEIINKGIGGYKAAVSSKEGQKNMGLKQLLSGVLYSNGELANNSTIIINDFKLLKIETEIGFRLNQDINEPTNAEQIKSQVDKILPVFEIPDITAKDPGNLTPSVLIASNTFSSHYLVGEELPANEIDPNEIVAHLYHNDKLINEAKGSDAMDNQWEALTIAINMAIDHGYKPKKGDLIITGALGKIFTLEKGTYTADYGKLGKLKLVVK